MKKMIVMMLLIVVMWSVLMTGGCATIVCGTTKTINISSQPPDANFTVKEDVKQKEKIIVQGRTPTNVTLNRSGNYTVTFEKQGYETLVTPIESQINGWYAGNILFGGIIGAVIDPITGAVWDLVDVNVTLVPTQEIE